MNYWNFKMYDKPYSINVIWDGPCWIKKPELNTILVLQYVIFPAIPKKYIGEILAVFCWTFRLSDFSSRTDGRTNKDNCFSSVTFNKLSNGGRTDDMYVHHHFNWKTDWKYYISLKIILAGSKTWSSFCSLWAWRM